MGGQVQKPNRDALIIRQLEMFVSTIPRTIKFTTRCLLKLNKRLPRSLRFSHSTIVKTLQKCKPKNWLQHTLFWDEFLAIYSDPVHPDDIVTI